ncbi:ABC transporter ATP-binding protein [Ruminiclostridium cellulolyticum]|uniref:ABC transporter related n=1 Tax=Ruminiclostridium cellulolyticum (strain ATCC 35319 / DSM 5812 / JCM 6584 / H10) TaxID=394503 RepID=B8I0M8_RUMCH|nr:ABC transporter ATP-binding protein [Ruminiclostridium cellulolyticum]ACL75603.1 ABC transporter related [Ruminiclostridium cellulolyticum H10]
MEKKPKDVSNLASIKNNFFALKIAWSLTKSNVIHVLLLNILGYFEWVFFSTIFMRYIINALEKKMSFESIMVFILISGGAFALIGLYRSYVNNVTFTLNSTKIYEGLYLKLYKKARNVELSCFEDAEFYNKYTMAIDDAADKIAIVVNNVWGILVGIIATGVVFFSMYDIDKVAVLFVIFPIIGNFVFGGFMNKLELKRYKEGIPNERVFQYVNRVMYLAEYAKEMRLSKVYQLIKEKYNEALKRIVSIAGKYAPKLIVMEVLKVVFTFSIIFEGVLLYGAYRAMVVKSISLSEMAVLSSTMVSATWILIGLFNNIVEAMKNGLFVNNLRTFIEYKEVIPEDWDGDMPEPIISSIEFRNVSFSYKDGKYALKNLNFCITENSVAAVVGHNGAGKSTIIKLLFRLYDPTCGEILINGRNIKEYNLRAYRQLFAAAFQDYKILALSVKDNVLMGHKVENEDEAVIEALKKAGVYEKVETLPKGINTILTKEFDEDGAVLSGGQYQKIVVARAFVQNTPIKVFDEPSSALDPIAEYELYKSIMKESKNKTMIFISHRLSSVRNADRVFMFERGELIEQGTHEELMELNGSYADMYTKQAMNYLAVDKIEEGVAL